MIVKDKSHIVLWAKREAFNSKGNAWYKPSLHIIEDINDIPEDFRGNHYAHDGIWIRTVLGEQAKIDRENAELTEQLAAQAEADEQANIKADTLIDSLKTMTMEDIESYIDSNVTTIASSKKVLKILAKLVVYLLKKQEK